jgi:hypothetical protein
VETALTSFAEVFELVRVVNLETAPNDPLGNPAALVKWGDRIAIVDVMQANVKVFDESGQLLSTLGRAGDGPGEFRRPFAVIVLSDGRLAVADKIHTRVSLFTPEGEYAGAWNYATAPAGSAIAVEGGSAIIISARRRGDSGGGFVLYIHEASGELRKTIEAAGSLPDPRAYSLGMPMAAVMQDRAFVVEPTASRMRVVGLHDSSESTMELSLPGATWEEWDWSQIPERPDEGMEWAWQQSWIREPLGDSDDELILPVSRFGAGPDKETLTSYVRVTADGAVTAATHPSPRWIASVTGDTAYGAEISADGASVLYVYRVAWP